MPITEVFVPVKVTVDTETHAIIEACVTGVDSVPAELAQCWDRDAECFRDCTEPETLAAIYAEELVADALKRAGS